jgi:hypothetical protein
MTKLKNIQQLLMLWQLWSFNSHGIKSLLATQQCSERLPSFIESAKSFGKYFRGEEQRGETKGPFKAENNDCLC